MDEVLLRRTALHYITGYRFEFTQDSGFLQHRHRIFDWVFLQIERTPIKVQKHVVTPEGKLKKQIGAGQSFDKQVVAK